jgi:hypothetical protein
MEHKNENQQNTNSGMNPNLKSLLIFVIVFIIAFFGTRALMAYLK